MNRIQFLFILLISISSKVHGQWLKNTTLTFGYANYGLYAITQATSSGVSEFLDKCRAQSYSLTLNRQSDLYKKFTFQYGTGLNTQILTARYNQTNGKLPTFIDDAKMRNSNIRMQSLIQLGYNVLKLRGYDLNLGVGVCFNGTFIHAASRETSTGLSNAPDTMTVESNDNKSFTANWFYSIAVSPPKGRSGPYIALRYVLYNIDENLNITYRIAQSQGAGTYRYENGYLRTRGNFMEVLVGFRFR